MPKSHGNGWQYSVVNLIVQTNRLLDVLSFEGKTTFDPLPTYTEHARSSINLNCRGGGFNIEGESLACQLHF